MPVNYRVTAKGLHLRKAPSIDGEIMGVLKRDLTVRKTAESDDKNWLRIKTEDGRSGWAAQKFLAAVVEADVASPYSWLPVALAEKGTKEAPGAADNPRVVQYLRSTTLDANSAANDETAWCSAFVNWCVEQAGFEGTNSAWARSWLKWGRQLQEPKIGCISVLKREGGGHVGFYMGEQGSHLLILGGNQGNAVNVSRYAKTRLLGYRGPL